MFQLYKGKIVIDNDKLPDIQSIKTLIKEVGDAEAIKLLLFMYLLYNREDTNPLKDFSIKERKLKAKSIAFGNTTDTIETLYPKHTDLIKKAFKDYEKLVIDKIQADIDLYDKKMYQFIELLDKNEPEIIRNIHEISGRVTFSTNIDIITSILDNSIDIILDKAALVMMQQTGKFSNELRGRLSPNVKGKLIIEEEKK
jgi:hypothetical protein